MSQPTYNGKCPGCDEFVECKYVGWQLPKTPLKGCAEKMAERECSRDKACMWKTGYPPLEFSEDADYQLLESESLFAIDGSVVEMIDNMDSSMLMLSGVVFVAALLFAMKQCLAKKEKHVDVKEYGSISVVH